MNVTMAIALIKERDTAGTLANDLDDFLFDLRDELTKSARFASALRRLRRRARGQDVHVDPDMADAGEAFYLWLDNRRSIR